MANSRIDYVMRNFVWGAVSNVLTALLGFVSRTVFIYTLGETYLGVSGLFSNILGVLGMAELGIASAVCFSLYKPMAEKDARKIQAMVNFYRTAYRMVAAVVAGVGLAILPFLELLTKGAEHVENLRLIYCIYLFNSVTPYLLTYKVTLLHADQRVYLHTNLTSVIQILTTAVQLVVLLIWKNFIAYLLIGAAVQLISKIYINHFVNEQYPFIKEKNNETLTSEERKTIFTKIKAVMVHRIGDISINQTDNIITSACVGVTAVGLVSNFVMIIDLIKNFIMMIFNSALSSFGNLLAVEDEETKVRVTYYYDFLGFCFFGWSGLVLFFCLTPFVTLWLGETRLIDNTTVMLLCINYYVTGARVPFGNVRAAAGAYEYDRWVPFVQAITNVVVSIVAANLWGLKGIYIGTLVSSIFPSLNRPYTIHKYVLHRKCGKYFCSYFLRMLFLLAAAGVTAALLQILSVSNPYADFLITAATSALVPLVMLVLVYGRTDAFQYFWALLDSMILSKFKRK